MDLRKETRKKHWMIKMEENIQNEDQKRRINERKSERKITNEFKEGNMKKHWMIKMEQKIDKMKTKKEE